MGTAALKSVARFAETMAALRERAEKEKSVADLLEAVITESGYAEALEAERTIEAAGRLENLDELVGVARSSTLNREVEGDCEVTPLEAFLAAALAALRPGCEHRRRWPDHPDDAPHGEGPRVPGRLPGGREDGVFPHSRAVEEGNLEEERRLCYVAITRAKQRLYLSCAQRRSQFGGRPDFNMPSRFLGEVPEALVERRQSENMMRRGGDAVGKFSLEGPIARPEPKMPSVEFEPATTMSRHFGQGVVTQVEAGTCSSALRRRRRREEADGRVRAGQKGLLPMARESSTARRIRREARGGRGRGRRARRPARPAAGAGHRARRRRPGLPRVRAQQAQGTEEAGHRARSTTSSPPTTSQDDCWPGRGLNADAGVDGILVQLPLPRDRRRTRSSPRSPRRRTSTGSPATSAGPARPGPSGPRRLHALGVMEMLAGEGIEVEGAEAVIVGRSILVGRPLAALLTNATPP